TVDRQGDNTILVYPGANGDVSFQWVEEQEALIREADWVMIQLEIPMESVLTAATLAKRLNKKVLLNPAPAAQLPEELISLVDILTPNETELALLSGVRGIEEGAEVLLKKGVSTVVVTLGARGSLARTSETIVNAAPYNIVAVDTTAAGDAFNAALVVALGEGSKLPEALAFANAAGALTATRMGAQSSLPTRKEVDQFRQT
ncbi:MAG: ribokinase, partial [Bacillota bacterium]|nr:ribokinase [Bacillota bacterium]